jgi:hypothetical protein
MAAAMALALAGCGGSSTPHSGATTSHSAATASGLPINAYVVKSGEEPGYAPQPPADYKTPQELQTNQAGYSAADLKRLGSEGFRAAAVEQTGTSLGGLSFVSELGSTAAARRELAAEVAEDLHGASPGVRFKVAAIPGAVGVAYPSHGAGGDAGGNVLFQEGRCMLLVGDTGTTSAYRKPAVAGATAIWKRTHAETGACSA